MAAVFFIISTTGLAALLLPTSHRVHGATVLSDPCTGASSRVQQGFANMVLDPDDGARSKRRARRQRRQQSTATTGGTSPSAGATPASVVAQAGTEQTLQQAAAAYAKLEQSQKLLQLYEEADEAEEALPVVIRALLRMRRVELALELYVKHVGERPQAEVDTRSTCSLFLALCRTRRLEDATELLSSLELAHPPPDDADARAAGAQAAAAAVAANAAASAPARLDAPPPAQLPNGEPLWHAIGALLRPSLALARLENGDVAGALELTERLGVPDGIAMPPVHTMTKLVRAFGKARCLPGVYACLDAQALARQEADAEGLQVLVDALVRDTRFVKGGVSMSTLPEEDYPEVAFVGRSNVGKSSMVNMVLGAPADPRQRRNGVWRQRRVAPTAYGANGVWRQRRVAPTANGVVPPTRLALADLPPPLEEAHHPRRLPDLPTSLTRDMLTIPLPARSRASLVHAFISRPPMLDPCCRSARDRLHVEDAGEDAAVQLLLP